MEKLKTKSGMTYKIVRKFCDGYICESNHKKNDYWEDYEKENEIIIHNKDIEAIFED